MLPRKKRSLGCVERLEHEYALKAELDADWAARPVALTHHNDRMTLVLEDPGGAPLDRLLGRPLDVSHFLRIAIPLAGALRQVHERGLIHKDIKPANILVDAASGGVWLTGFGIASRLPRERQAPAPPEVIAGTLAYMAPEQTGRMNRSVDSRSDLYALGVTFYEMLTGQLPFTAADPMEWVHCHIARQPVPPSERVADVPAPLSAIVMKLLAKTAEERYQTAAGVEADLRRCLAEWEAEQPHRRLSAGRARHVGPAADPGEAVRPGARDRHACSPPSTASSRAARRSSCSSPAIPASASPRSSTSCTRRSSRRAACSRPASSISTSATSRTRRWARPSRALSARS